MSPKAMPVVMRRLLDESGIPWRLETGGRHHKLFIDDRMVCVLPLSGGTNKPLGRQNKNSLASVRRAIRSSQQRRCHRP